EGVADETLLEQRSDDGAQRMMDHAIAERRGGDDALLGVADFYLHIAAGAIGTVPQFAVKADQLAFQVGEEGAGAGFLPLAAHRPAGGGPERGEIGDAPKQIIVSLRHVSPRLPPPIEIGCCRFRSLYRAAETRVYAVSAGGGLGYRR